mmetsp:Transcript_42534/g.40791  ORF Transcript_42534/g.40791 Transcript_42534/m.40791 type:complete len:84 (+) Transcript_42534:759-1010(+)
MLRNIPPRTFTFAFVLAQSFLVGEVMRTETSNVHKELLLLVRVQGFLFLDLIHHLLPLLIIPLGLCLLVDLALTIPPLHLLLI